MQALANLNGEIRPAQEMKISIFDRGFLYGDSIYEVVRTYNGVPFFHQEHLDRLENSARLARMRISQSREEIHREIRRTVQASGAKKGEDVFVRYTITRGTGPLDLDPASAPRTSCLILVKELPQWKQRFIDDGVVLAVPRTMRNSPACLDPNIKSGNYLNNILAVAEAKELGADDALMLSADGRLTEASNSNFAFIRGNEVIFPLHEPETHTGNLKGITKRVVSKLCVKLGLRYTEKPVNPGELGDAEEAFVSSATREVMPVRKVILGRGEEKTFRSGGGDKTRALREAYAEFTAEYAETHAKEAFF